MTLAWWWGVGGGVHWREGFRLSKRQMCIIRKDSPTDASMYPSPISTCVLQLLSKVEWNTSDTESGIKHNLMNTHIPVLGYKVIQIELKPMYPALIMPSSPKVTISWIWWFSLLWFFNFFLFFSFQFYFMYIYRFISSIVYGIILHVIQLYIDRVCGIHVDFCNLLFFVFVFAQTYVYEIHPGSLT